MGYHGTEIAQMLGARGIICEFADPDYIVFMLSPETGEEGLSRLEAALLSIRHKRIFLPPPPAFAKGERVLSIREAALAPIEMIPVGDSIGRILGAVSVGCPPAVPILVCGERIDGHAIACFEYYGIRRIGVVKE